MKITCPPGGSLVIGVCTDVTSFSPPRDTNFAGFAVLVMGTKWNRMTENPRMEGARRMIFSELFFLQFHFSWPDGYIIHTP